MKRTDHILALTATLLSAPEKEFLSALFLVGDNYTIDNIRKPNTVSLGAREEGQEISFAGWAHRLRKEGILKASFFYINGEEKGLPDHIKAGFAGFFDLLLEITTASDTRTYTLQSFHSPQYEITPQQFISLLDSQPDKELVWARAATLILESNALNQRSAFTPAEAPAYLTTDEGGSVFNYLVANLISEIQIELAIHDQAFIIPESLQPIFIKYDNPYFVKDDREYVYLYPLEDVTAPEILALVAAQPYKANTWEALNATLKEYADPDMPPADIAEWENTLMQMEPARLNKFVHPICRSICRLCEDNRMKPVIPRELANRFGPDEVEQKRASARSKAADNSWSLQPNSQPWEYYQFRQIENIPPAGISSASETREKLIESLKDIEQFAATIQSPYEEAFRLSHFLISTSLPSGVYDEEHINRLSAALEAAGFSERAINVFRNNSWAGAMFTSLHWKDTQIQSILAVTVADVFGGMGSWNDQYVEGDQQRYQAVSAALFKAVRKHFASVLSSPY